MGNCLPSKFLCCSLQAGAIVVGTFGMILAGIFFILEVYGNIVYTNICSIFDSSTSCNASYGIRKLIANLLAFLAAWNALELFVCIGLIVGASKGAIAWVTAWLAITLCWIALHSAMAISFLFADVEGGWIAGIALAIFVFVPIYICAVFSVMGYHKELNKIRVSPPNEIVPAIPAVQPVTIAAPPTIQYTGYHPNMYPQQPIY